MMSGQMYIYVFILVYFSLTIGILIKFMDKGVKGYNLLLVPIVPIFIIAFSVKFTFDIIKDKKIRGNRKIAKFFIIATFGLFNFPILVGYMGEEFSQRAHRECSRLREDKARSNSIDNLYNLYYNFYKNDLNKKLILQ